MKMSFVIPAHNEETTLAGCLSYIADEIRRSGIEAEIIVVDNASTDRTADIARSFPNVIVVHEPRKGSSRARQTGFAACTGDFIANVDADNRVPPGWIAQALDAFAQDPRLVVVTGPDTYYDLSPFYNAVIRLFYWIGYVSCKLMQWLFGRGAMIQGGNFVVRRSAMDAIGGYNVDFSFYGDDVEVAGRLRQAGRVLWTFSFTMPSSGRRYAAEGMIVMSLRYGLNYLWTVMFGRPYTLNAPAIRLPQPIAALSDEHRRMLRLPALAALVLLIATGIGLALFELMPEDMAAARSMIVESYSNH